MLNTAKTISIHSMWLWLLVISHVVDSVSNEYVYTPLPINSNTKNAGI